MTALIIGGSGQLGTAMRKILPDVIAPSRAEFDLNSIDALHDAVVALAPSLIINCAAYTAVDAAETDETEANRINGVAVGELTRAAADLGVPFVTYSTDYVFDGLKGEAYLESDVPAPLNAYGRSKVAGEELALEYAGSLVVRTSWLLSATHPNFVTAILDRVVSEVVQVVDDQWGRPTMVDDLAAATLAELESGQRGLLHLASPPTTTWYGLAQHACHATGIDAGRVEPCSTTTLSRAATRPRYAVLASEKSDAMPEWRPALSNWLQLRKGGGGKDRGHPATDISPKPPPG